MARKNRKRPLKAKPTQIEELEPRILFSADLPGLLAPLAHDGNPEGFAETQQLKPSGVSEIEVTQARQELVFVDPSTPDRDALVRDIVGSGDNTRLVEVVLLDETREGLQQISDVLKSRDGLDAIHIVSHGTDGVLALGAETLNLDTLLINAEEVASWGNALSESADLMIYGCDLAATVDGENFVATLAGLTGADVAASDDTTGHTSLGGDWQLEFSTGAIETATITNQGVSGNWLATLAIGASNLDAGETYVEDTPLDLADIVVSGSASGTVTATLTLSDIGAGTLSTATSGAATSTFSAGVWTASGAEADVNALLADVVFVPTGNYNSDFTIATQVNDGVEAPLSGVKVMTAIAVNDAPAAGADSYTLNEDSSITTTLGVDDLLQNDSDVEGDPLTVNTTPVSGPDKGTLVLNADGTFTYTPDANFNGNDSFVYEVSDGNGGTAQATVNLTVNPVNDAPVPNPAATFTLTPVFMWDADPAGDGASNIIASSGGNAITDIDLGANEGIAITSVDNSNGTWEYSTDNGNSWNTVGNVSDTSALLLSGPAKKLRFVPNPGYSGTATFTFRAWDMSNGLGNGVTGIDVSVNGGETAYSADVGTASIDVVRVGATLFVSTQGDVTNSGISGLRDWSSGSFLGISSPEFEPGTSGGQFSLITDLDTFASDANVQVTALHYVTADLTVGTNQTTNLQEGDMLFVAADAETLTSTNSLSFNAGDVIVFRPDVSGDYSTGTFIHLLDNPGTGTTTGISLVAQTTLVGDTSVAQGSFLFTQSGGQGVYHFTADETGAGTTSGTASLLIDFNDIAPGFTDEVTGVHLVDSALELNSVTLSAGTVVISTTATADVQLGDNNATVSEDDLVYLSVNTTTMGGTGTSSADATVLFEGKDAKLNKASEFIRALTFVGGGNGVIAGDDSYTLSEDSSFTATLNVDDLLLNDTDADGDPLSVNTTPVSGPANGTLVLNADGTFTYTPDADFNGTDSFVYEVSDGNGGTAQATVTLTVNPVNDPPVAVDDAYTLNEDTPLTATLGVDDLLQNDSDVDGDTLTVNTTPVSGPANGTLVLNADGTFTYTPNADFNGTDSFVYEVSDGNGGTAQATVTLTINPVNDPPVATDDAYTLNEDTPLTATLGVDDLLQNDSDVDGDTLSVNTTPVSGPANGTLVLNADGTFTYTPDANFNGTDSFVYEVSDGNGGTAQATVTLTINPVNDPPVAVDDAYTLTEDTTLTTTLSIDDLLLNDSDIDGDTLSVNTTPVSGPANGTLVLNADGTFSYTPNADYTGPDSFVYEISDGNGGTAQATVALTVYRVNDAPVATPDSYTLNEDTSFTATLGVDDLLLNDTDADGDSLTVNTTPVSGPANGTLVLNADGTFTYTPDANFNGTDSFVYEVSDGFGGTAQGVATLNVDPVNDTPVAIDDAYTLNEDTPLTATLGVDDLLLNDSDIDGDTLTVNTAPVSGPANGTLVLNTDGTFTYTPDANFNGTDSFVYEISDVYATTAQGTVTLTVTAINDAPAITSLGGTANATFDVNENNSVVTTITAHDIDGDPLTFSLSGGSDQAAFSIDSSTGALRFNLPPDYEQATDVNEDNVYQVTVTAADSSGATAQQTLDVTVFDANDAPDIEDQAFLVDPTLQSGDVVGQASAFDQDAGDSLMYAIVGGNGMPQFSIDDTTGLITASNALSLELAGQTMSLTVEVTDNTGASSTATVLITISSGSPEPLPGGDSTDDDSTDDTDSGSGTDGSTESQTDSGAGTQTTTESAADDDLMMSQKGRPGPLEDGFGSAANQLDDQPREPSPYGNAPGSALERGVRAVVDILFDNHEGEESSDGTDAFGLSFEQVRFEAHLGRAGSGTFEALLGPEELNADAGSTQATVLRTATATGLSLSVGFVAWALRTGALMAGLFAARPVWQGFDPLPVLKGDDDEDGEEPFPPLLPGHTQPNRDLLGERFDR